jgi:hypothetical protein
MLTGSPASATPWSQRAVQSEAFTPEKIAPLYGVLANTVTIINYPLGPAIKVVVPCKIMSGDPGDRDVYGAQQHTPLLELDLWSASARILDQFSKSADRNRHAPVAGASVD